MATTLKLILAEGVTWDLVAGEEARLSGRAGELRIRQPSPGLRAALTALASSGATEAALTELAGPDAVMLFYYLEVLGSRGQLRWTLVTLDGAELVTLSPVSPHFVRRSLSVEDSRPHRLSRFAYSRVDGERVVLECPLSHAVLLVHDRRVAALLFELARPVSARELAGRIEGLAPEAARAVLQLLAEAGMLEAEEPPSRALALRQWEFHDLLFHTRSRGWRHDAGMGGTRRFAGQIPSLPAIKPPMGGAIIELTPPDIEALRRDDAPFTEVLERRRSVRARGTAPLTAHQLSEFLFRCARVRQVHASEQDATSDRPYPGAGARYELEVYPVVHACEGIPSGLYHYCPERHVLERLEGEPAAVRALLEGARSPEPPHELPDVLLILAARFQRVAWRYESIAYSLILKDVGVLFQTMYLVATAMRLAPCAIGHGDPDLFSRAAGTDRHVESSVGEFTLSAG